MEEIALTMSGGGYRAAMFHLGTLSYLNHLNLADGRAFLDIVNTISTISGGTITGLWHMMNYCACKNVDEYIVELYNTLVDSRLPETVLELFLDKGNMSSSLIKELIKLYDNYFFHGQTFGVVMKKVEEGHIHHFSANGTDFSTGLAFRFQASRSIKNAQPAYRYGIIGNHKHKLNRDVAAEVKLSEILAVSSCFPGGFEPVVFPDDFTFYQSDEVRSKLKEGERFNLMDGGIVDNQGIEPVLLASQQMSYDHPDAKGDRNFPCHDLIIVSDVSSPEVKSHAQFSVSVCVNPSLASVGKWLNLSWIVLLILAIMFYIADIPFASGIAAAWFTLCFCFACKLHVLEQKMWKWLEKTAPFPFDWKKLKYLNLKRLLKMLESRLASMVDLAQSVFMKPIRQMRYKALYENPNWKNRLVSNNVSELSSTGSWRSKNVHSWALTPSATMQGNSDKACSMGTTLWFTEEDKKQGIPQALFAAGQYTICMNLLEYIMKLEKDNSNTTPTHVLIMACKRQLECDWEQFQRNPHFLIQYKL